MFALLFALSTVFAQDLELSVAPETPLVIPVDAIVDTVPISGPWFRVTVEFRNVSAAPLTVAAMTVDVQGREFTNRYNREFEIFEIAPQSFAQLPFYFDQLPIPPDDRSRQEAFSLPVKLTVYGWTGSRFSPENRLMRELVFTTR